MLKLVTHTPISHADKVREAIGIAGAGEFPNYKFCSFSTRGVGRFIGEEDSNPNIGEKGKLVEVEEEKIEVIVKEEKLKGVIEAIRSVHPYEEIPIEVSKLESYN